VLEPLDLVARLAALVPPQPHPPQRPLGARAPRAERISRRRSNRRGIPAAGLVKQGLSAARSGSPWRPFHE
jgi:hypothetical protein